MNQAERQGRLNRPWPANALTTGSTLEEIIGIELESLDGLEATPVPGELEIAATMPSLLEATEMSLENTAPSRTLLTRLRDAQTELAHTVREGLSPQERNALTKYARSLTEREQPR